MRIGRRQACMSTGNFGEGLAQRGGDGVIVGETDAGGETIEIARIIPDTEQDAGLRELRAEFSVYRFGMRHGVGRESGDADDVRRGLRRSENHFGRLAEGDAGGGVAGAGQELAEHGSDDFVGCIAGRHDDNFGIRDGRARRETGPRFRFIWLVRRGRYFPAWRTAFASFVAPLFE